MLVMVSSHSRFITAPMIPSRMTGDLLDGMWELLRSLGAVPWRLIWDNETYIGPAEQLRRRSHRRQSEHAGAATTFTARVRLPRDYYGRMRSNDYSVHPQAIGHFVEVTANLTIVTISLDGRSVGTRRRSWGRRPNYHRPRPPRGGKGAAEGLPNPSTPWPKQPGCGTRRTATAHSVWSSRTGR